MIYPTKKCNDTHFFNKFNKQIYRIFMIINDNSYLSTTNIKSLGQIQQMLYLWDKLKLNLKYTSFFYIVKIPNNRKAYKGCIGLIMKFKSIY